MRIAIIAFEALPGVGTEAGLAWHWGAAYRRLGHQVTVITQASGGGTPSSHLAWREMGIEVKYVGKIPLTVAPKGLREMLRNFFRYSRWTSLVTEELIDDAGYDLVHQISLSSIRLPWVKPSPDVKFVLGPVGGAHIPPIRCVLPRDWIAESFRALSIPFLGLARWIDVKVGRSPDIVYVTNDDTRRFAERIRLTSVEGMLTDGISPDLLVDLPRRLDGAPRRLVWAGRMVGSKRPDLALSVLAELNNRGVDVSLAMVGDGPELDNLRATAVALGVAHRVEFTGRVSWPEVIGRYESTDAFLFTSVRDSSCPGVLEAAARGRPSLAFRHQGVGALVPDDVALGPEPSGGSRHVVKGLADAGALLFSSNQFYSDASAKALAYAATETWPLKAHRVLSRVGESAR